MAVDVDDILAQLEVLSQSEPTPVPQAVPLLSGDATASVTDVDVILPFHVVQRGTTGDLSLHASDASWTESIIRNDDGTPASGSSRTIPATINTRLPLIHATPSNFTSCSTSLFPSSADWAASQLSLDSHYGPNVDTKRLMSYQRAHLNHVIHKFQQTVPISTSLLPISLPHLRYDLVRSPDGRVTGYRTIECDVEHSQTATTSTSYKRVPTQVGTTTFTRGSGGQMPFRPGGLDDDDDFDNASSTTTTTSSTIPDRVSLFPWENTDADIDVRSLFHHHASGLSHGLDDADTAPETDMSLYISTTSGAPPVDQVDFAAQVEARRQQQQMKLQQKQVTKNNIWDDQDEEQLGGEEKKQENVTTVPSSSSTTITASESIPVSTFLSDASASLDPTSMSVDERALLDTLADVTSRRSKRVISEWCVQQRMAASAIAEFHTTIPNPALRFPFELDTFQKEAVLHLERGECVFVSAHTSAGKTVVAEYAIALSAKHLTRAIYTSPIKTLSNQKFREFRKTFGESSVGIMTGDVSINPEASCLILTTEILRSMLYRGADLIRDIEWVIFDEVHYVNDLERGVVWEEVIIMLPAHINIILLSATVPNTAEFADWVGRTKRKKIYVISTEKRPVPLQHFLWCKNKLWNIVDASGRFNAVTYKEAKTEATGRDDKEKKKPVVLGQGNQQMQPYRKATHRSVKQTWTTVVNYLQSRALLPVAVFSFSKKMCEECASALSTMDLTTGVEKSEIHVFVNDALQRLAVVDRTLPQVQRVRDLVRRGIGIHHAGMLPILKEVVELVFQRGLVKVLFATETFAMGVNMPTKTVIFNGLRKNDGVNFRPLHPGEYTQMSGRAGRRGLDTFGVVVIHCRNDEVPDEATLKQMILGRPTRLESRFRLTYNMILNLLRQEDIKVEDMIRRSFGESAQQKQLPEHKLALRRGEQQLQQMNHAVECRYGTPEAIREYFNLSKSLSSLNTSLLSSILSNSKLTSKYLCVGRVMVINKYNLKHSVSALVKITSSALTVLTLCPPGYTLPSRIASRAKEMNIHHAVVGTFTYVILDLRASDIYALLDIRLDIDGPSLVLDRHPSKLTAALTELSKIRIKYSPAQQKTEAATGKRSLFDQEPARGRGRDGPTSTTMAPWTSSIEVSRLPILDLSAEIRVSDMDLADEIAMKPVYEAQLNSHICHTCPDREAHYAIMSQHDALQQRLTTLKHMLSDENVELMNDFEIRVAVLQQLGYVDTNRTVQLKGRVACEINTCDSLILTELIFENVLTLLSPEEICSLLSSLVFQQKDIDVEPILTQKLDEAKTRMIDITTNLAQLQVQHGMELDVTEYIKANVNIGMMQVVYEWAKGTSFSAICELTTVPEGTIVRAMMRLEETCRDVRNAARVIGDPKLYQNMTKCSELLKRDIVFAASLYVT